MSSLSVKLPLRRSIVNGFMMNRSLISLTKQNLKMLLLTNPGERIMVPNYGVGLKSFLFENFTPSLLSQISTKIKEQVNIFMPAVNIVDIVVNTKNADTNTLSIIIIYSVSGLIANDLIEITI
tara:strand:+ start:125 stop:493 length:369 start_codon:yes stop_codon:yes gene_type:complete